MNWVKKRVKTKVRNKGRARVTEVGLAPVETLVVEAVETPVEEAAEILAEAAVETLAEAEEVETPVEEAVETSKMKGPRHRLQTRSNRVGATLSIPQGDRKGPHPAPHHPRPYYDPRRVAILLSS